MNQVTSKKFKIGFLGAGGKLTIENGFLSYSHPYGRTFKVLLKDIETVTVDAGRLGSGILKIIGKGTTLAEEKMPIPWANKFQEWILTNKE